METSDPTYDYIICGGGTAGCALASRLAEASFSVLIIEAGGPKESVPFSAMPAASAQVLGTEADWNFYSEPNKGVNNRKLHLGRGKFIGGTSGANGTLCIRGTPADYDAWDVEGWSDWFRENKEAHGYEGPLLTSPHDNAPISDRVMKSYESSGLKFDADLFSTGRTPHGCGHVVRSVYKGERTTAADYISGERESERITIKTFTYVDSVVFEGIDGTPTATGVNVVTKIGRDEAKNRYMASKEVILATGTYGTPAILLRSGIGPKDELAKHDIPQRVHSPGVGQNLTDHMVILTFYEVSQPRITHDHLIWHGGAKDRSVAEWFAHKTGFMAQFPFGSFAYARLSDRLADSPLWQQAQANLPPGSKIDPMGLTESQPHVEFWNTECYSPKYLYEDFPSDDKHAFAMAVELFSPRSKGWVGLSSRDPLADPVIQHNHLSDPLDLLIFAEGCRLANEIAVKGAGTKDIIVGSWPSKLAHHAYTTREEWEQEIRARADTCYHPGGTSKMGSSEDAVVDERLKVRGVRGLRVVDASVFPKLPCGHPQMAVYAVAEKAADMIKEDAS